MELCYTNPCVWILGLLVIYKLIDRLIRIPKIGGEYSPYYQRYVLITGASRGLGYEAVRRFDSLGVHVFAGVRSAESAAKIKKDFSTRVEPILLDVTDPASVRSAFDYVTSKLSSGEELWGLINNAGVASFSRIEWLRKQDYRDIMEANTFGLIDVTMTFLPLLKKSRGRIVNVSSGAGRNVHWFFPHYNMSKYALEAFSDCLRRSVRAYGVKVVLIEPGLYRTDIASVDQNWSSVENLWSQTTPEMKKEFGQHYLEEMRVDLGTKVAKASDRIGDVIDTYEHAVFGRFPRARYVVGTYLKYIWLPVQTLPEWLSDFIMDKVQRPPLPAILKNKQKQM